MAFIGIIPARYASTRFPGKPLALLHGRPVVQWVYERACEAGLSQVAVATDDDRIRKTVEAFGGQVVMTSPDHRSGTDRCAEAACALGASAGDVIVNIQGDEPFIRPEAIRLLTSQFERTEVQIATLAKAFTPDEDPNNPNMVKVVAARNGRALYFSRSPIPYYRNEQMPPVHYKHIGIYAYRLSVLNELVALESSQLEEAEKLEQLRWLDNGYSIFVRACDYESVGIDTPEDLARAEKMLEI